MGFDTSEWVSRTAHEEGRETTASLSRTWQLGVGCIKASGGVESNGGAAEADQPAAVAADMCRT